MYVGEGGRGGFGACNLQNRFVYHSAICNTCASLRSIENLFRAPRTLQFLIWIPCGPLRSVPLSLEHFGEEESTDDASRFAEEGFGLGLTQKVDQDLVQGIEHQLRSAEAEDEDFGDWARTDELPAAVGGVSAALAPYLTVWTQLLQVGFGDSNLSSEGWLSRPNALERLTWNHSAVQLELITQLGTGLGCDEVTKGCDS